MTATYYSRDSNVFSKAGAGEIFFSQLVQIGMILLTLQISIAL